MSPTNLPTSRTLKARRFSVASAPARLLSAILLLAILCGCHPATRTQPHTGAFFAMDTFMSVSLYESEKAGQDEDTWDGLLAGAEARVRSLEAALSVTAEDSAVARLNRLGTGELTGEAGDLLERGLALCAETDGALDLTIYPVVRAWGFTTGSYRIPSPEALQELLSRVDYTAVETNREGETLRVRLPEGAALDLGAVAKGYTGDVLATYLTGQGISSALLELGGNIHAIGTKPDGSDWRIAIQSPTDPEGTVGVLQVADRAVVTSGGYERYFEQDGVRYWHILDPSTGSPARSGLLSVTIIGPSGLRCDALSTALFVMGPEKAIAFWQAHPDFDAVLIGEDGSITITEGIENSFTLQDPTQAANLRVARRS